MICFNIIGKVKIVCANKSKGLCVKITNIINSQICLQKLNFRGSAKDAIVEATQNYQTQALNASKAYAAPLINNQNYKEVETFDVPNVGKGKLYELKNGHKVAIVQKKGPMVINTFVKAGRQEDLITSHLLEHLVYDPRNIVNGEKLSEFQTKNAITHQAWTFDNYTNYIMKYPYSDKEGIDNLIKAQATLLQNPTITPQKLETQKKIVWSEYVRGEKRVEFETVDRAFCNALLYDNKPFNIDYSKPAIDAITEEKLLDFHKNYYQNNNMISVIVGDVEHNEILNSFSKYFNQPNLSSAKLDELPKEVLKEKKEMKLDVSEGTINALNIGFVGPKNKDKMDEFLNTALSSYVNYISRKSEGIDIQLHSIVNGRSSEDHNGMIIVAKFKNGQQDLAKEKINKFLHQITDEKITNNDLERLKKTLKYDAVITAEDSLNLSTGIGVSLTEKANISNLPGDQFIDDLTAEDLQKFAKKYFDFEKQLTMAFPQTIPSKDVKISFKGYVNTLDLTDIKEKTTDKNLQIVLDTPDTIKTAVVSFNLKSHNTKINSEAAHFLASMLVNKSFANDALLDKKPNVTSLKQDKNKITADIKTTSENTVDAINSLKFILFNPDLSQENFKQVQKRLAFDDAYANISYQDVIKAYNDFISNGEAKVVVTVPKNDYKDLEPEIFKSLTNGIPKFRTHSIESEKEYLSMPIPSKTKAVQNNVDSKNALIVEDFPIYDLSPNDIKKKATIDLLSEALHHQIRANVIYNEGLAYVAQAQTVNGIAEKSINVLIQTPTTDSNEKNVEKVLSLENKIISELSTKTLASEKLENLKAECKGHYYEMMSNSKDRNSLISNYTKNELESLFKVIDEITPEEIQAAAARYLKKPEALSISANSKTLEANKDLLESLN